MAYAIQPSCTFESRVTDLSGVTVTTTIVVPADAEWSDMRECSELASMGASSTAKHVHTSIMRSAEKEPPF